MRASEIATRTVRHLDGHGTLLDITNAKTEAGERTLKLPKVLQPLLAGLAKDKQPEDRLFGEVCGLVWPDVDLERRIITVRRSYDGPTKSARHREVPIPSVLVDILRRHRHAEPYQGELVFPNDAGEMYTKNGKLEDVLRPALARVGLRPIRIHDLRHVYGAHWVMAGGSIYDLQRNLGHHSVAFTAAVYGHLSQDHRVKESDRLSGLFAVPAPANVLPLRSHNEAAAS